MSKKKGEQFVWGPGDIEVTKSPSGKYPPGQKTRPNSSGQDSHKKPRGRRDGHRP